MCGGSQIPDQWSRDWLVLSGLPVYCGHWNLHADSSKQLSGLPHAGHWSPTVPVWNGKINGQTDSHIHKALGK